MRTEVSPRAASFSQVEVRSSDTRPSITLVAREGDPFAAVAIAIAHDGGAEESMALSELLLSRFAESAPLPVARPSGMGVVLVAAARTAEDATRFIATASDALARPVTSVEAARVAEKVVHGRPLRSWKGPAESAVGGCVGELSLAGALRAPSQAELEAWRGGARSARVVAFSAVGPRPILEATSERLVQTPEWPETSGLEDPWPSSDVVGTARPIDGAPTLSVALRVTNPARAVELAEELGRPGSALAAQLSQTEPPWTLDRAVGVVRPRGGCIRVDARLPNGAGAGGTAREAARVATLVIDEATRQLAQQPGSPFSLDRGVLEASDPRDAATIAAWQALSGKLPGGPVRTFVSLSWDDEAPGSAATFAAALGATRAESKQPTLELRSAVESGQGQVWILLASPCSSAQESPEDAGGTAVLVRAVAEAHPVVDGVHLEPWISGEGTGLLAHGARLRADESPGEQARRVADALGRALAAAPLTDTASGTARMEIASELGSDVPSLWTTGLDALAPGRPSLLEPRGTWQSVANLSTRETEVRRRALVRGPLRMAVLGNASPAQATVAEQALSRWLRPLRDHQGACPFHSPVVAKPGEYWVDAPLDAAGARALVAVPLSPGPVGVPLEARFTAHLLNREGGWLESSLRIPGLAPYAAASVLGGSGGAALVVEIALPGRSAREAVAQVRALFDRLAHGAATPQDLALASTSLATEQAQAMLDPRYRAVRLWLGRTEPAPPDLPALRRFHEQVLAPERHVVVMTRPRP